MTTPRVVTVAQIVVARSLRAQLAFFARIGDPVLVLAAQIAVARSLRAQLAFFARIGDPVLALAARIAASRSLRAQLTFFDNCPIEIYLAGHMFWKDVPVNAHDGPAYRRARPRARRRS